MRQPIWQETPSRRRTWWWAAAGLAGVGIGLAVWSKARPPADPPAAATGQRVQAWGSPSPFGLAASQAQAPASKVAGPAAAAYRAPVAALTTASAASWSMPPVDTPAESLRKVQQALAGGTPEEALYAAVTLNFCKHAASIAESLHRSREGLSPLLPPEVRKALEKMAVPPPTNEDLARADQEQRRCQVFDAATLARSGELLRRAYEGKARGAAHLYLTWLQGDGKDQATPELVATLQAEVQALVEAGDPMMLSMVSHASPASLGVTPVQARAYRNAWLQTFAESSPDGAARAKNFLAGMDELGHAQPLTAEQQREADALAQKIVEAWHKRMHGGS